MSNIETSPVGSDKILGFGTRKAYIQGLRNGSVVCSLHVEKEKVAQVVAALQNQILPTSHYELLQTEPLFDTIVWTNIEVIATVDRLWPDRQRKYNIERRSEMVLIWLKDRGVWHTVDSRAIEQAAGVYVSDEDAVAQQKAFDLACEREEIELQEQQLVAAKARLNLVPKE